MAWQERDYHRHETGNPFVGASMVKWLLCINAGAFLLDAVLTGSSRGGWLSMRQHWGYFSVERGVFGLQIWRWVTYQFVHHDFFHLLFNMIGLYFFGPVMERWWGSRRFLSFYLLCGFGAAATYTVLAFIPGLLNVSSGTGLVGASGCIFGILMGCALLYPHQKVMLLFPPVPMKMQTMAFLFIGLAMLSLVAGSPNAGGEAAHLGGAALGWALIRRPGWLNFTDRLSLEKVQSGIEQAQQRNRASEEAEVDRILGKVRAKGLASLTNREKKILQRATDRQRNGASRR